MVWDEEPQWDSALALFGFSFSFSFSSLLDVKREKKKCATWVRWGTEFKEKGFLDNQSGSFFFAGSLFSGRWWLLGCGEKESGDRGEGDRGGGGIGGRKRGEIWGTRGKEN